MAIPTTDAMTDDTERMVARYPETLASVIAWAQHLAAQLRDGVGEEARISVHAPTVARRLEQICEAAALLTKERGERVAAEKQHDVMWRQRDEYRARAESAEAEAKRLREALAELVACKDLNDRADAIVAAEDCNIAANTRFNEWVQLRSEYRRRKPAAWEAARALLRSEP